MDDSIGLSKTELLLELWTYRSRFLRYVQSRICGLECAEDIFQEACLKFLASKAVFFYPQAGTRYFCRILRSLVADRMKQALRLQYRESLPEIPYDPWTEYEQLELVAVVRENCQRLPARDQNLLAAYLTAGDGDGMHKLPRGTMRHRISRVLVKLRRMAGEPP